MALHDIKDKGQQPGSSMNDKQYKCIYCKVWSITFQDEFWIDRKL